MDFSSFLENKRDLLKALKEKEIPYFKAIVDYHPKPDDHFVEKFEDTIDKLLEIDDPLKVENTAEAQETWEAFRDQTEQFYKYVLDESFDKEMRKIEDDEEVMPEGLSDLEKLCRVALFTILQDFFQKKHVHENVEPYFRKLWNFLLEPLEDEGGVKRIMTFNTKLDGILLNSKIVFHRYSWLKTVMDNYRRHNKNSIRIDFDGISESEKQAIEAEIAKAYKTGEEKKTVLESLGYVYFDILFHILKKCVPKQFEAWILHEAEKWLATENLLSINEMKLILACLSKDEEWRTGREAIVYKWKDQISQKCQEKTIFAKKTIFGWNVSNINQHIDNVNISIDRLNQILKKYIENQVGKEYASAITIYYFYLKGVYERKVDSEKEVEKMTNAFSEIAGKPLDEFDPPVRDILLDRLEVDELEKYNIRHRKKKIKNKINGHFYEKEEEVKKNKDKYPECEVYACIRELPGLNAKAMEVFK